MLKGFNSRFVVDAGALLLWLALLPHLAVAAPASTPVDLVFVLEDSDVVRAVDARRQLSALTGRLLDELAPEARVALIVFDDVATPLVRLAPLDATVRQQIVQALESRDLSAKHTNSAAGLERAIYELTGDASSPSPNRRAIVLLHAAPIDVGDASRDASFRRWAIEVLADKAMAADIKIHSLALGPLADRDLGSVLAERTGGLAQAAAKVGELDEPLAMLHDRLGAAERATAATATPPTAVTDESQPFAVARPDTSPAPPNRPAAVPSAPEPVQPVSLPAAPTDAVASLADLPVPASDPATILAVADKAVAENRGGLLAWSADHTLWRALAYVLVASVLAAVTVGYLRRRRQNGNAAVAVIDSGPRLIDINKVTGRNSYPLEGKMARISRAPGTDTANVITVHIPQDVISRAHAFIDLHDDAYWVTDPGSNNGTFVNGERVDGSRKLRHGDRIKFAAFEFVFEISPAVGAPARGTDAVDAPPADDSTVVLGQAETEFMRATPDAERTVLAPRRAMRGQSDGARAEPDPTIVRPAR